MTQYSRALVIAPRSRVLDAPLEPVIGLAEGEIRWRGMTPNWNKGSALHTHRHQRRHEFAVIHRRTDEIGEADQREEAKEKQRKENQRQPLG
jgi:hypothetical protein